MGRVGAYIHRVGHHNKSFNSGRDRSAVKRPETRLLVSSIARDDIKYSHKPIMHCATVWKINKRHLKLVETLLFELHGD